MQNVIIQFIYALYDDREFTIGRSYYNVNKLNISHIIILVYCKYTIKTFVIV